MFDDQLSFRKVVQSLEGTLGIEYEESARVDEILDAAIRRLEEKYGPTLDKDIYTTRMRTSCLLIVLTNFLLTCKVTLSSLLSLYCLKSIIRTYRCL